MAIKREDVEKLLDVHHYDVQAWHTLVHAVLEMGDALERMRAQLEPDSKPEGDGEFERFSRRYGELRAREMSDDELRANGLPGRAIEELRARPGNADERARTISQADVDRAYERSMYNFQQPLADPQQFREQPPGGGRSQPQSSFQDDTAPQDPRRAVRRGDGPRVEPRR
jgi:hypothetical protein